MKYKLNKKLKAEVQLFFSPKNKFVHSFEDRVNNHIKFLREIPSSISLDFPYTAEFILLDIQDTKNAEKIFNKELNENLKFIWVITSYKIHNLLLTIIREINNYNFYVTMILARQLIEVAAMCNYMLLKIDPLIKELNTLKKDHLFYNLKRSELEELLWTFKKGTKNKNYLNLISDSRPATRVTEIIKEISREDYKNLSKFYSLFCECTHPNLTSNYIFGAYTRIDCDKKVICNHETKQAFIPGDITLFYRKYPDNQLYNFVNNYGAIIESILLSLDLFKETVNKFKQLKLELFSGDRFEYHNIFKTKVSKILTMYDPLFS